GGDAFRTRPDPTTPDKSVEQKQKRVRALFEFAERIAFVKEFGFDFGTLSYLLQHKLLPGAGDIITKIEQQLTQTLTELRSALQSGVVLGDVSVDNVKRQLTRLGWYPALIEAATGPNGLNYLPGASIELDIPPAPAEESVIPLNLRSKFTYRK